MAKPNPFEPTESLGFFDRPEAEYQINVEPLSELDEQLATEPEVSTNERSFRTLQVIFVVVIAILTFRLVNLQVTNAARYSVLAKGNRIETRRLTPPRGEIIDRNGLALTKNTPTYNLNLYPAQLPVEKADRETIYQHIESVTSLKATELAAEIDKRGLHSLEPVTLRSNLDRDIALLWEVEFRSISGITVDDEPTRSYLSDAALGHVLGYIGKQTDQDRLDKPNLPRSAQIGKTGLEAQYDQLLQGQEGKEEMEVDSRGQIQRVVSTEAAVPGQSLQLYLDTELQKVMTDALQSGISAAGKSKGVAIAIDPQNGGVLGMVSLPSYDDNLFVQPDKQKERQDLFNDKDLPLFNRAIAGVYPPGSTSKPIWAVAGLSEGVISESTRIQTPAQIMVGQSIFPDWKAHGSADVKQALAESNNIFFYAVAGGYDKIKGLGPINMKEWASRFGWGQRTGIDLPGEKKGLLPDPEWKKKSLKESWFVGDTYHQGIGQGYLAVTPIQLVRSIVAIANGGTLYEPRFVKTVKDSDGKVVERGDGVAVAKNIVEPNIDRIVREGMRQTVLGGTARPLNDIPMPIAGKTGTAQFTAADKGKTHAWFVGFAPYDKPSITLLVMVEDGGESFTVAVPIAKKILSWYSDHYYQAAPASPR